MNILVTGASGFVGRALVRMALERRHRVAVLVRGTENAPAGTLPCVHDLGSGASLLDLPEGLDAIVHLAQSRAYRNFPGDADEMFRVNVTGTHELLLAAARGKVKRFCLVSSGTVYEPFLGPLTEDATLMPSGNLGATKLAAEIIARPYGALFALSTLRLFAPYGPGQTGRLIPDFIQRISCGEAVTLPAEGGGMCFAPSYVDDVCEAILTATEESWSGIFNIAAPFAVNIEEAANIIGKALGKAPRFDRHSIKSSPPRIVPDLTKLGQRFDLGRFRGFGEGIALTLPEKM